MKVTDFVIPTEPNPSRIIVGVCRGSNEENTARFGRGDLDLLEYFVLDRMSSDGWTE